MSFKCKVCGPVANCKRKHSIPVKIRDVAYNLQVKTIYADGENVKTVKRTTGKEIVAEADYCLEHIPKNPEVITVGKAVRDMLIKTVASRRFSRKEED